VFVIAGLRKSYSTGFKKIRPKGGSWSTEETVRFWWQSGSTLR